MPQSSSCATTASFLVFATLAGSAFLFTKHAKRSFSALTLAATRLAIGASLLSAVRVVSALCAPHARSRDRQNALASSRSLSTFPRLKWVDHCHAASRLPWLHLTILGFFNSALPYSLYPVALSTVNVGAAAILAGVSPMLALALARCLLPRTPRTQLSTVTLLGMLLGLTGVALVSSKKLISGQAASWTSLGGYVLVVLAACSKAFAAVYAEWRAELKVLHPVDIAWAQTMCAAVLAVAVALIVDFAVRDLPLRRPLDNSALTGVLYLGIFSSCAVYYVQFFLIRTVGAVRQITVDFAVPVVGLLEGVLFDSEWHDASRLYVALECTGAGCLLLGLHLLHREQTATATATDADTDTVYSRMDG